MSIAVHIDLRPALGPVRDQGARPTCLSMATTVAHEHARGFDASLAPEYLHYFASAKGSTDGVLFPDVTRALKHPGQPVEADCPYYPGGLPPGWHPPKGVNLYRRESEPRTPDGNQIAALLDIGRVPVLGISVPQPFYSPIPPWVISPDGPIRGRHAVAAVALGAAGATRCFLVRNSWGTAWGNAGHAWLDETFIAQHLRHLLVLTDEIP